MAHASWVDVDRCSQLGEAPGRPCMIEMNVAEKDMPHVVRRKAGGRPRGRDVLESRRPPRVEEGQARGRGERAKPAAAIAAEMFSKVDSGPVSKSAMPSLVSSAVAAMIPGRPRCSVSRT